ncbi:hypothetical protein J4450_02435 [Candidatus Micrarchaeota archaeon]|nr:hypothetical protein [Candidatus Micrarchaeota archaeon]
MVFSLERILFSAIALPGEQIRIAIALLGLLATTYFDLFNKRNVPNNLLYAFLGAAIALNLLFYEQDIFLLSIIVSIPIAFLYIPYKMGQIGGADVLVLLAINFALPIHPSLSQLSFNFPFIASTFVFSGVIFALYFLVNFSTKLLRLNAKPNMLAFALLIPYAALAYLYINSPLYSPIYLAFISIMLFSSMFFIAYRNDVYKLQAQKIALSKAEQEDVLALELMDQDFVKKNKLQRLLTQSELVRLKKLKIKELWVYTKLPPFLPFLLVGFILALFYSKHLLLF